MAAGGGPTRFAVLCFFQLACSVPSGSLSPSTPPGLYPRDTEIEETNHSSSQEIAFLSRKTQNTGLGIYGILVFWYSGLAPLKMRFFSEAVAFLRQKSRIPVRPCRRRLRATAGRP